MREKVERKKIREEEQEVSNAHRTYLGRSSLRASVKSTTGLEQSEGQQRRYATDDDIKLRRAQKQVRRGGWPIVLVIRVYIIH